MAKARKGKPSFGGSNENRGDAGWVYRSDAGAADTVPAQPADTEKPRPIRRAKTTPPASAPDAPSDREAAAHVLVDRYVKYSSAAGLVPVPVVDVVAIASVQVTMVGALASHYGVPYNRERGKTLIASMLGGLMPSLAGHQMLKVFGPLLGMASVAGFAAATTYAVGHVFIAHFESGGTPLDLDIDQARRRVSGALSRG